MVWLLYYLAITTPPGSPPKHNPANQSAPAQGRNIARRWCNKCKVYKPERAHHCRKCGVCILAMDHHCPWINNCIGHGNTPHFMRFLVLTEVALAVTIKHLLSRLAVYYEYMHMPAYLVGRMELCAVFALWPVAVLVFLSILVLLVRCLLHLLSGKTQIEVWEYERIESQFHTERLWLRIRKNYEAVHGKKMGALVSWNKTSKPLDRDAEVEELSGFASLDHDVILQKARGRELTLQKEGHSEPIVPPDFTPDDLIFPYDMGMFQNLVNALGPVYTWVLPWGHAKGNGLEFPKNEDDDQLNLPWPPDGGNIDVAPRIYSDEELRQMKDVSLIKKHLDPRSHLPREKWTNDMGEGLADFGVDIGADGNYDENVN